MRPKPFSICPRDHGLANRERMTNSEWGMAFPMVVVYLHDEYNDTATLTKHYDTMKKYMQYLDSKADTTGVISYGLG